MLQQHILPPNLHNQLIKLNTTEKEFPSNIGNLHAMIIYLQALLDVYVDQLTLPDKTAEDKSELISLVASIKNEIDYYEHKLRSIKQAYWHISQQETAPGANAHATTQGGKAVGKQSKPKRLSRLSKIRLRQLR